MFIILNWKALYFLTFANTTVTARIQYFDEHTSWLSTLVGPVLFGILFAAASPWIALFSTWLAEEPIVRRKIRQARSAERFLTMKFELEQARLAFQAQQEEAKIESARRDQKVQEITDPKIREDLQQQIDELRQMTLVQSPPELGRQLTETELSESKLKFLREQREYANNNNKWDLMEDLDELIHAEIKKLASSK